MSMTSNSPETLRVAACEMARAAGAIICDAFGRGVSYQHKSAAIDLVTDTDRAAESCIVDRIRREFPDHGLLGEEGATQLAQPGAPTWIVDPLDGTTNFAHGIPHVAVSIAVVQQQQVLAGVVYDPLRDELFSAASGGGARLNQQPLHVSTVEQLGASVVATGFPYDRRERAAYYLPFVQEVLSRSQGIRRLGAAALDLAWVAAGRFEAYWELGVRAWDIAAGTLLVREAGGTVTDHRGGALDIYAGRLLSSNGRIHRELVEALAAARPPADLEPPAPPRPNVGD